MMYQIELVKLKNGNNIKPVLKFIDLYTKQY